jgi:hypothetical protein
MPDLVQTGPAIVLAPASGGPGTTVAVSGSGFPPETQVSARLGPPSIGATPRSYGDAVADADGVFTLLLTIPAYWPNGTAIAESELEVVVLNPDGSIKATAPFAFNPRSRDASADVPDRAGQGERVVLTWYREGSGADFCDYLTVYWSGRVQITSCKGGRQGEQRQLPEDIVDQLHAWVETYQSFDYEQDAASTRDGVASRLTFAGTGSRPVSEVEKRAIQELLAALVSR